MSKDTLLPLLWNVKREFISSRDKIFGILMRVLLMAVSISHNRFFDIHDKFFNAFNLFVRSAPFFGWWNCFQVRYWNAPTYTWVSMCRFRNWIYWEKKKKEKWKLVNVAKKSIMTFFSYQNVKVLAVCMPTGNRSNTDCKKLLKQIRKYEQPFIWFSQRFTCNNY